MLEHETIDGDEVVAVMEGKEISRSSNGLAKKNNAKSPTNKSEKNKTKNPKKS